MWIIPVFRVIELTMMKDVAMRSLVVFALMLCASACGPAGSAGDKAVQDSAVVYPARYALGTDEDAFAEIGEGPLLVPLRDIWLLPDGRLDVERSLPALRRLADQLRDEALFIELYCPKPKDTSSAPPCLNLLEQVRYQLIVLGMDELLISTHASLRKVPGKKSYLVGLSIAGRKGK